MSQKNAWEPPIIDIDEKLAQEVRDLNKVSTYRLCYSHDGKMFDRRVEATRAWYEYVQKYLLGRYVPGYGILTYIGDAL